MADTARQPVLSIQLLERSRIPDLIALGRRNHPSGVYDEAAARKRLEHQLEACEQGASRHWTIHLDGVVVGDIGFNQLHRGSVQSANVGYMVDASARGRGVATAALRLVIRESFEALHLHRLEATTLLDNLASQRVLEKAGFRRVGVLKKHEYEDGAWRDYLLYELVGPDAPPIPSP